MRTLFDTETNHSPIQVTIVPPVVTSTKNMPIMVYSIDIVIRQAAMGGRR